MKPTNTNTSASGPKRFGQTGGARVDPMTRVRLPLSQLAGQEIRVFGWESETNAFGEMAVIHFRRHGGVEVEEAKTSSAGILAQLRGCTEEDFSFDAWVCQAPAPFGYTGRLYFSDTNPSDTNPDALQTERAMMGRD